MEEAAPKDPGSGTASVNDLAAKIESLHRRPAMLQSNREALEQCGESQPSFSDPDARAVEAAARVAVDYNVRIAVDLRHNLIAEQKVHKRLSDPGLLAEPATAAPQNLGAKWVDVLADRGYCKLGDIEACEAAGVTPCVSKPRRSLGDFAGRSPKSAFHYDKATDPHVCPAGERLSTTDASKVGNTPLTHDVNYQGAGSAPCESGAPRHGTEPSRVT